MLLMASIGVLSNWPARMLHHGECDIDAERAGKASGPQQLTAEHMTLDQAATLMGMSTRYTRRILAAYGEEGAAALAHGHRGHRAPNTTSDATRSEVLRLAQTRYPEVNHTHLSELLRDREGIDIGRTTLRRILVGAGLKSPRHRRPPRHRVRRQRMPGGHADTKWTAAITDGWEMVVRPLHRR